MPTRSLTVTVIRPEDLLLRLDFVDVDFTGGAPPQIAGQGGARLIVHFQPQHVAEQAFWEVSDGTKQTPAEQNAGQPALPPGNDPLPDPGTSHRGSPARAGSRSRFRRDAVFRSPSKGCSKRCARCR